MTSHLSRLAFRASLCASLGLFALAPGCGCDDPEVEKTPPDIEVLAPGGDSHLDADPYLMVDYGDVDSTIGVTKNLTIVNHGGKKLSVLEVCFLDAAPGATLEEAEAAFCLSEGTPYGLTKTSLDVKGEDEGKVGITYDPTLDAPTRLLRIESNDKDTPFVIVELTGSADIIPGSLSGCFCNDGVGWVESATVNVETPYETLSATTDDDGCFLLTEVPSGATTITVNAGPYTFDEEVEIEARKHNTVATPEVCNSPTGDVVGCVCDDSVFLWVDDGDVTTEDDDGNPIVTDTDENGCFTLIDVPVGARTVTIEDEDGFSVSYDIEVKPSSTTSIPSPATCTPPVGTVTGCICDESEYASVVGGDVLISTDLYGDFTGTTDADGCFSLEDIPVGSWPLSITAPGFARNETVDVTEGGLVKLDGPSVCAVCSYESFTGPFTVLEPVDIVLVVDSSGSMGDENDAVEDNLNAFSDSIAASGIDHHVILIGEADIPPPLGGSNGFMHVDTDVGSHDALLEILGNYDDYQDFLREGSQKHFIIITDDSSSLSALNFKASLANLTNPGFGAEWVMHSIVGYGNVPDVGCDSAAGIGEHYLSLSEETGGLTKQICGADFTEVFDAIYEAVTFQGLPCTFPIPDPPEGSEFDPTNVEVRYTVAGEVQVVLPGPLVDCDDIGWRFDDAANPTAVEACPETCLVLDADKYGEVELGLGCIYE